MKNRFLADERGVEPTALKIMAGVIMLAIGLSIGVAVYKRAGGATPGMLSFSVTLSPSATIGRPTSGENTKDVSVSVQKILDYSSTVTLSYSGNPSGVTVTFAPSSGTPNFYSTMTVHVDNTTTFAGTTTITIRATGADGTEQTGSFELTVA